MELGVIYDTWKNRDIVSSIEEFIDRFCIDENTDFTQYEFINEWNNEPVDRELVKDAVHNIIEYRESIRKLSHELI